MTDLIKKMKCPREIKECKGLPQALDNYTRVKLFNWGEVLESVDGKPAENVNCENFIECYSILVKQGGRYRRSAEIKIQH